MKQTENTDVLKDKQSEKTLIYEKMDRMQFISTLVEAAFSVKEMPQNLENRIDAYHRLAMNRVVKSGEKICT